MDHTAPVRKKCEWASAPIDVLDCRTSLTSTIRMSSHRNVTETLTMLS